IFYFLLTNVLVLLTISIIFTVLPIGNYIGENGTINYGSLLVFSAVIGVTGSFISLAMSRWIAKRMMGVEIIDPNNHKNEYKQIVLEKVYRFSTAASFTYMSEVEIYT